MKKILTIFYSTLSIYSLIAMEPLPERNQPEKPLKRTPSHSYSEGIPHKPKKSYFLFPGYKSKKGHLSPSETKKTTTPKNKNSYKPIPIKNEPEFRRHSEGMPRNISTNKSDRQIHKAKRLLKININHTTKTKENTALILFVREKRIDYVQALLNDPDLNINHKNIFGNTALHYAALNKSFNIINSLLHDIRTDASIKNAEGVFASNLIIKATKADNKWRQILFARAALNTVVNEESTGAILSKDEDINKTIEIIKTRISNDVEEQKERKPLPKNAQLPDYIDDEFIEKMIQFAWKTQGKNTL